MHDLLKNVEKLLVDHEKKRPWLAESSGIPLSTINNWFSNDRMPRADHAVAIAHALNTTVEYLLTGKGPPREQRDPEIEITCQLLDGLSKEQIFEIRGVIKSYIDLHFRRPERKEARSAG